MRLLSDHLATCRGLQLHCPRLLCLTCCSDPGIIPRRQMILAGGYRPETRILHVYFENIYENMERTLEWLSKARERSEGPARLRMSHRPQQPQVMTSWGLASPPDKSRLMLGHAKPMPFRVEDSKNMVPEELKKMPPRHASSLRSLWPGASSGAGPAKSFGHPVVRTAPRAESS